MYSGKATRQLSLTTSTCGEREASQIIKPREIDWYVLVRLMLPTTYPIRHFRAMLLSQAVLRVQSMTRQVITMQHMATKDKFMASKMECILVLG